MVVKKRDRLTKSREDRWRSRVRSRCRASASFCVQLVGIWLLTLVKNPILRYNELVKVCLMRIDTKNNLELKKHETGSPVSVGNHKVHIE
jgi:hypothetical protein